MKIRTYVWGLLAIPICAIIGGVLFDAIGIYGGVVIGMLVAGLWMHIFD